jgi:hypothetical protein
MQGCNTAMQLNSMWEEGKSINAPDHFCCPITKKLMENPVTAQDGRVYERDAISLWFKKGLACSPITGEEFKNKEIIDNLSLRNEILKFRENFPPNYFTHPKGENLNAAVSSREKFLNLHLKSLEIRHLYENDFNLNVSPEFYRPITSELFVDPVITADGITYERSAIESWFAKCKLENRDITSPKPNTRLGSTNLIPNFALKQAIDDYFKKEINFVFETHYKIIESTFDKENNTIHSQEIRNLLKKTFKLVEKNPKLGVDLGSILKRLFLAELNELFAIFYSSTPIDCRLTVPNEERILNLFLNYLDLKLAGKLSFENNKREIFALSLGERAKLDSVYTTLQQWFKELAAVNFIGKI